MILHRKNMCECAYKQLLFYKNHPDEGDQFVSRSINYHRVAFHSQSQYRDAIAASNAYMNGKGAIHGANNGHGIISIEYN